MELFLTGFLTFFQKINHSEVMIVIEQENVHFVFVDPYQLVIQSHSQTLHFTIGEIYHLLILLKNIQRKPVLTRAQIE